MFKIYLVVSAALLLLLDVPFDIFTSSWGWWATPLLLVGFCLGFVVLHVGLAALLIATTNLDKPSKDGDFFRRLINGFLQMALPLLRVKVHTTGVEKIPADEPFLLVSNHIHDLDPAIIYYAAPDSRLAFIGKKEVRELFPFVYKALHRLGGLPIDRENNREAAKTIISAARLIKEGKNSVAVFPEGYVSKSGELLPLRNGALKIATKTGCKIVVCTLWGTKQIPKNLLRRKTDINFDVLDVIDTSNTTQTAELGERISELMLASINNYKSQQ